MENMLANKDEEALSIYSSKVMLIPRPAGDVLCRHFSDKNFFCHFIKGYTCGITSCFFFFKFNDLHFLQNVTFMRWF